MNASSHLVVNSPIEHQGSVLGRVVAGKSCLEILANINRVMVLERAIADVRAELAALRSRPHCDFLALHSLSEFRPYRPYSNSIRKKLANDEPLFAKGTWKPVLTHKSFGSGTLLRITENQSGNPVAVVRFVDGERNVPAFWLRAKRLEKWWAKKVKRFSFRDASPAEMDSVGNVPMPRAVHVESRKPKSVDAATVHSESVARARWDHVIGFDKSENGITRNLPTSLTNFDPALGLYVHQNGEVRVEVRREKTLEEHCEDFKKEKRQHRGFGPIGVNRDESKAVARLDLLKNERLQSWLADRAILISRGNNRTAVGVQKIDKVLCEKYGIRSVETFLHG